MLGECMTFWTFEVKPDRWHCYCGIGWEKETSAPPRMISFRGNADDRRRCTINGKTNANGLPVYGRLWVGEPGRPEDPDHFLPKNMPEWHRGPPVNFGSLDYLEKSVEFNSPESLQLIANLPEKTFEDMWQWLRTGGALLQNVYVEVVGRDLTAHYGYNEIGWSWSATGGKGTLLVVRIGASFGSAS